MPRARRGYVAGAAAARSGLSFGQTDTGLHGHVPEFDVRTNAREFERGLTTVQRRQLPWALRTAINWTLFDTIEENQKLMRRVIDRPTRFTLNSQKYKKATASDLHGAIGFREFAGKGIGAGKYLRPIVFGGGRRHKRHEVALREKGILGPGKYFVPAPGVRLNAYGNIPGSRYVKILSQLKAFPEEGYIANWRQKRIDAGKDPDGQDGQYFVPRRGSKLRYGIYLRHGEGRGDIKPILIEINAPRYSRTFDFFGASQRTSRAIFPPKFARALRYADRRR
jgi:hypothetical protein